MKARTREGEMKKVCWATFIIFLLLYIYIEAQAQSHSIFTGIVTEFHRRGLVIKGDDGQVVQFRVGWRTVYHYYIPTVGERVKVEYSIIRGVYVGFSVAILENEKKEIASPKQAVESRLPSSSNLPLEISRLGGKWEGSWDNKKDYGFTLTISNVNSKIAEVKYESKDLEFFEKANVIPGEKPRIEWVINSIMKPDGPFVSPAAIGTKDYFAILSESIPIYYTFEIQKDGTLEGVFDSRRLSVLGTSRKATMKKAD
jgi:hypothetical protein